MGSTSPAWFSHCSFLAWLSCRSMEHCLWYSTWYILMTSGLLLMLVPLPTMTFSISLLEFLIFQDPRLLGSFPKGPRKRHLFPSPCSLSILFISWCLAYYLLLFIYLSLSLLVNFCKMECYPTSRHPWIPHAYLSAHNRHTKVCWPALKEFWGLPTSLENLGTIDSGDSHAACW